MREFGFAVMGIGGVVALAYFALAFGLRRRGVRMRASLDQRFSQVMLALAWVGIVLTTPDELLPIGHAGDLLIVATISGVFICWTYWTMYVLAPARAGRTGR